MAKLSYKDNEFEDVVADIVVAVVSDDRNMLMGCVKTIAIYGGATRASISLANKLVDLMCWLHECSPKNAGDKLRLLVDLDE